MVRKLSAYAQSFNDSNPNWSDDHMTRRMFFEAQEKAANDRYRADGYLFLNSVYDSLGMNQTRAGHSVGWVHDDPENEGVVFVLMDQPDGSIYVDFNVQGAIVNRVKEW